MQLFVQFPDFSSTTALDRFIGRRLTGIQKRLSSQYKDSTMTLRGSVTNRRPTGLPKGFEAELMVKIPKKAPLIVKKKNKDFRAAVKEAADTMENKVRDTVEKIERSRMTLGKSRTPLRKIKRRARLAGIQ